MRSAALRPCRRSARCDRWQQNATVARPFTFGFAPVGGRRVPVWRGQAEICDDCGTCPGRAMADPLALRDRKYVLSPVYRSDRGSRRDYQ